MVGLVSVSDAAEKLGVSVRQVQHLVARGDLHRVARGLVDETSIERYVAVRSRSRARAWSSETAWTAVALLSGARPGWIGASQSSRLRQRLGRISSTDLVERTRGRARVTRYAAHSSVGRYLLGEVVHTRRAESRLGLASTDAVDGYVAAAAVPRLVAQHGLRRDDAGRVTLRATSMSLEDVRSLAERGVVLAALDLAESLDVRERRAGLDALDRALEEFRA
jgi:hypothetical protein